MNEAAMKSTRRSHRGQEEVASTRGALHPCNPLQPTVAKMRGDVGMEKGTSPPLPPEHFSKSPGLEPMVWSVFHFQKYPAIEQQPDHTMSGLV